MYVVLCLIVFGCQYQCNWLPGKTNLQNDLLCVEWDVKPYTLTHLVLCNSDIPEFVVKQTIWDWFRRTVYTRPVFMRCMFSCLSFLCSFLITYFDVRCFIVFTVPHGYNKDEWMNEFWDSAQCRVMSGSRSWAVCIVTHHWFGLHTLLSQASTGRVTHASWITCNTGLVYSVWSQQ